MPAASGPGSAFRRRRAEASGFTLLELLLIVIFLGLLATLAGPRLTVVYDRVLFSYRMADVVRQLSDLTTRAFAEHRDLTLATWPPIAVTPSSTRPPPPPPRGQPVQLDLPSGWQIIADPPIEYRFDGYCTGGRVTLVSGERRSEWQLTSPHCLPRSAEAQ